MTIRQRLYVLSALVLIPALLCAAWGLYFLYTEKLVKEAENVRQVAQVLTTLIERELALREATLHALSVSPALARGDLGAFHELARAVALSDKAIISLSNTAGRELLVSTRSYQAKSARPDVVSGFREEMAADATVFSNLYFVPGQNVYRFGVQVPVMRGGKVIYYLTMENGAEVVQHWLAAGKLPTGWNAAVLDRNGYIMASTLRPDKTLGAPAGDAFFPKEGATSRS
ncbi:MAG: cache domain-containing protein, partial [Rhodospirillaceae bacterium]